MKSYYRDIGDVPFDVIEPMLRERGSPMLDTARETHDAAKPHTALFWAQGWLENQWKATGHIIKPEHNNPLSIRPPYINQPGPYASGVITAPDGGQFETYDSDADCAREWKRRLFDEADTYKGGVYGRTNTLEEMLGVYAPSGDVHPVTGLDNADTNYLGSVTTMLERFAGNEGDTQEDTGMATHRFVLSAGHRNINRGGATREIDWTYPMTKKLQRAIQRRGGSAWIIQEEDGDNDPTFSHGRGLQNVARLCVDLANTVGGVDAYISMHYGGEPRGGCFFIHPDGANDTKAMNPLDVRLCEAMGRHTEKTGMPRRAGLRHGPGVMSERETGVGLQGYRLGEFVGTMGFRTTTARVIAEGGNYLTPADRNRLWSAAWQDAYAEALVDSLEEVFGPMGGARPQPDGLTVGDTVEVTERLNLRKGWGTDSPVVTTLDVGTEAEIIDGPRSANGYIWYDLKGAFGSGWAASDWLEKTEKQPDPTPVPQYPAADPIPALSGDRPFLVLDSGATFVRADLTVKAVKATPRLRYADPNSAPIGPDINPGEQFSVDYICINPDGSLYWYTPWATRVRYEDTEIVQADVGAEAA